MAYLFNFERIYVLNNISIGGLNGFLSNILPSFSSSLWGLSRLQLCPGVKTKKAAQSASC
jgi:hypothetical protein